VNDDEYYSDLKLMFSSKGWGVLVADLEASLEVLNSVDGLSDGNALSFRQGELCTLRRILAYPLVIAESEAGNEDETSV
jgi:hypothetical protein